MRNRSTLTLMEQLLMVLIFSLASALCLQVFAKAHKMSHEIEMRDAAILLAQNAAEIIKGSGGDMQQAAAWMNAEKTDDVWAVYYDENGTVVTTEEDGQFRLEWNLVETQIESLGKARINVFDLTDTAISIFGLDVMWQEVQ